MTDLQQTYKVEGLRCAACVKNVEFLLSKKEEVNSAKVNFANSTVSILFERQEPGIQELQKLLAPFGFKLYEKQDRKTEEVEQKDQKELRLKLLVSFSLMIALILSKSVLKNNLLLNLIQLAIVLPIIFWSGVSFFSHAYQQAKNGIASMDTLVSLGVGTAFVASLISTFFPEIWQSQNISAPVFYEGAAMIVTFLLFGKYLEFSAQKNANKAIENLLGLRASSALVLRDNSFVEIPIEDITIGDQIKLRSGDKIPVDGKLIEGENSVDESAMTGEAFPVLRSKGDDLLAGTIILNGNSVLLAKQVGKETILSQIIKSVEIAQSNNNPVQKLADKVSSIFVPVVIGLSLFVSALWLLFGPSSSLAILALVNMLIIACPCALGLATPTALAAGLGKASENGILVRNAEKLSTISKVTDIVFDKTGTLTTGKPTVVEFEVLADLKDIDSIAASFYSIEQASSHPLAKSICRYIETTYETKENQNIESVNEHPGKGISAKIKGSLYYAGNKRFLIENGINTVGLENRSNGTAVYFADNNTILAIAHLEDKLKENSKPIIHALNQQGYRCHLLSGDNNQSVEKIASELGLDSFRSEVLPNEKAAFIADLKKAGATVAMAGDGINDAPALAHADLSFAMGTGSNIAIESADISLVNGDLKALSKALKIGFKTERIIKQNLFWAFFYNLLALPLAAGILYPITGTLLHPGIAGAAMAFSSVSVVLNSLRLRYL